MHRELRGTCEKGWQCGEVKNGKLIRSIHIDTSQSHLSAPAREHTKQHTNTHTCPIKGDTPSGTAPLCPTVVPERLLVCCCLLSPLPWTGERPEGLGLCLFARRSWFCLVFETATTPSEPTISVISLRPSRPTKSIDASVNSFLPGFLPGKCVETNPCVQQAGGQTEKMSVKKTVFV